MWQRGRVAAGLRRGSGVVWQRGCDVTAGSCGSGVVMWQRGSRVAAGKRGSGVMMWQRGRVNIRSGVVNGSGVDLAAGSRIGSGVR